MRKFLKSISPLTTGAQLKVPLFIVQGAKDTRVPPDQAEAMVRAVRANGTPVWYVVYDAGHEELPTNAIDFNQYAWVLFVQKYSVELTGLGCRATCRPRRADRRAPIAAGVNAPAYAGRARRSIHQDRTASITADSRSIATTAATATTGSSAP